MSGRLPARHPSTDPQDRRIRRSWWFLAGSFFVLGLIVAVRLGTDRARPIDFALAVLVVVVGYAAALHRTAVHALEVGRRGEAESFARILQGLSRSVSPDAIVDAIVEELGVGVDADHIVVVRQRPDAGALEATLVSRRPGVRSSTTLFPLSDLEDPLGSTLDRRFPVPIPVGSEAALPTFAAPLAGGGGLAVAGPAGIAAGPAGSDRAVGVAVAPAERQNPLAAPLSGPPLPPRGTGERALEVLADLLPQRASETGLDRLRRRAPGPRAIGTGAPARIAERISDRVRSVYGLKHTLAAPLSTDDGVVGAIVLSRRTPEPWSASVERILAGAAVEASAALARAISHREAETRASTDALTGLPNRRYFDEFCGLLARRRRADDAVGVLMVDIDHFKAVNDAHGHAAGDAVLRAVAGAIGKAVREDDVPARYGGEEFAVLLRNPSPAVAIEIGERIRQAVGRLDLRPLGASGVTVSVGVAVAGAPDQPIGDIIEAADAALYRAKRAGRDRVIAA